ncbi:MAG: hypothetical protein COA47_14205 [Robiginitomaculum sp.]|nr:MAG: hypothetical protein COA47_14205 [Robiginitomaculum sp.]
MNPVAHPAPTEPAPAAEPPVIGRARSTLLKRLSDLVCLPESRISPVERHMAGDLLMDMLREAEPVLRARCAKRVAALGDAPPLLLRMLAADAIDIAAPILEQSPSISDADLVAASQRGGTQHRILIARRKRISEMLAEELTSHREPDVAKILLRNDKARLSNKSLENLVELTRAHTGLCRHLLSRPELRPSQGLTLFWWANTDDRKRIFLRYSVDRVLMQESASDVFEMVAAENWQDPLARKAMQFIERRQRNRAAIAKSPYDSLEAAIDAGLIEMNAGLAEEISYLSGIKPITGARILADTGGEPIAILCKATGLKRDYLAKLWTALRRNVGTDQAPDEAFERVRYTFDTMSSNKAQTVLRYWNWALSSSLSSDLRRRIRDGDMGDASELSAPERSAALVFGRQG